MFRVFSREKGLRSVRFSVGVACRPAAPDVRTPAGISPQSGKCPTCRIRTSGGRRRLGQPRGYLRARARALARPPAPPQTSCEESPGSFTVFLLWRNCQECDFLLDELKGLFFCGINSSFTLSYILLGIG